ncbi:hypothetical protein ACE6H2_022360 [Prunus campanulata]
MRKGGAKRKVRQMEIEASQKPADTQPLRKRVKAVEPKPSPKPESPEETRKLEELWKAAFPIGTGWDKMEAVHNKFKWDFTSLEQALEEGGKLHQEIIGKDSNKVYLFGTIECHIQRSSEEEITVPVVVAIVSPSQPAYELSIKPFDSQGNGEETRVPMEQLHMDWVPYIPPDKKGDAQEAERVMKSARVFVLGSTHSRAALKSLKEEGSMKLQHYMPYLDHKEEEDHWCWVEREIDEVAETIIDELKDDNELSPVLKAGLKEYVLDKLYGAKRKHQREVRQAMRKSTSVHAAPEAEEEGFEDMKIYKFYPKQSPETPDISKAKYKFINKYCGKAHEVL